MNLVVDASVVFKWLFQEPDSDRAETLLEAADRQELKLVAPEVLTAEVGNGLWKRMLRGDLDRQTTLQAADHFERICPLLYPIQSLWRSALTLAIEYEHPVYDCLYLALAEDLPCELITADKGFHRTFARIFPRVQLLGNWGWHKPRSEGAASNRVQD
jgi:predicted nucleic acid-binding protein